MTHRWGDQQQLSRFVKRNKPLQNQRRRQRRTIPGLLCLRRICLNKSSSDSLCLRSFTGRLEDVVGEFWHAPQDVMARVAVDRDASRHVQ